MCSHMVPVARAIQNIIFKDLLQLVSIYFVALLSSIVASTGLLVNAVCCILTTMFLAEAVRFELTVHFYTSVFKTDAIGHSTTLPKQSLYVIMNPPPIFFCAHNFLLKTKNPGFLIQGPLKFEYVVELYSVSSDPCII